MSLAVRCTREQREAWHGAAGARGVELAGHVRAELDAWAAGRNVEDLARRVLAGAVALGLDVEAADIDLHAQIGLGSSRWSASLRRWSVVRPSHLEALEALAAAVEADSGR